VSNGLALLENSYNKFYLKEKLEKKKKMIEMMGGGGREMQSTKCHRFLLRDIFFEGFFFSFKK
jgi:hypothetical protein